MRTVSLTCNDFVPIVFLVISLIISRFGLNQITNLKKEIDMEQIKNSNNNIRTIIMNGVRSIIEVVLAIGTSIAGTGVLKPI